MITSAQIARYRGIRDLVIDGFGRVNLFIGKNDCGKTALMEALRIGEDSQDAAHHLYVYQTTRLGHGVKRTDFDRFWRPLFFNLKADLGLVISVANEQGVWNVLEVRQGAPPSQIISDEDLGDDRLEEGPLPERASWSIELRLRKGGQEHAPQQIVSTPKRIQLPPVLSGSKSYWISSGASVGLDVVRHVSELKQTARDGALLELLREVDVRLSGIELLAPSGSTAELFIRLDKDTPLLPLSVMGEGFQRCIELGAAAAAHDWSTIFVDEIENGMHHLVLEPLCAGSERSPGSVACRSSRPRTPRSASSRRVVRSVGSTTTGSGSSGSIGSRAELEPPSTIEPWSRPPLEPAPKFVDEPARQSKDALHGLRPAARRGRGRDRRLQDPGG